MKNPYEPPQSSIEHQEHQRPNRLQQMLVFCTVAYALHVLALWGIACFHDAHIGSQLREPFKSISSDFGAKGLLFIALVYAIVPALAYFTGLMLLNRWLPSEKSWSTAMNTAGYSLGPTLAVDGVLGLPLFTTG